MGARKEGRLGRTRCELDDNNQTLNITVVEDNHDSHGPNFSLFLELGRILP